jgi:hypothetical protein
MEVGDIKEVNHLPRGPNVTASSLHMRGPTAISHGHSGDSQHLLS